MPRAKPPERKKRELIPENETKSEKFLRLVNARVTRALKAIEQIGKLASPSYDYTEGESIAVTHALQDAIDSAMSKFENTGDDKKSDAPGFDVTVAIASAE